MRAGCDDVAAYAAACPVPVVIVFPCACRMRLRGQDLRSGRAAEGASVCCHARRRAGRRNIFHLLPAVRVRRFFRAAYAAAASLLRPDPSVRSGRYGRAAYAAARPMDERIMFPAALRMRRRGQDFRALFSADPAGALQQPGCAACRLGDDLFRPDVQGASVCRAASVCAEQPMCAVIGEVACGKVVSERRDLFGQGQAAAAAGPHAYACLRAGRRIGDDAAVPVMYMSDVAARAVPLRPACQADVPALKEMRSGVRLFAAASAQFPMPRFVDEPCAVGVVPEGGYAFGIAPAAERADKEDGSVRRAGRFRLLRHLPFVRVRRSFRGGGAADGADPALKRMRLRIADCLAGKTDPPVRGAVAVPVPERMPRRGERNSHGLTACAAGAQPEPFGGAGRCLCRNAVVPVMDMRLFRGRCACCRPDQTE